MAGDGRGEGGVRVAVEAGVGQIGDLWFETVEFEDVGAWDGAGERAGAAFVDPQQRRQLVGAVAVEVEGFPGEFPERG